MDLYKQIMKFDDILEDVIDEETEKENIDFLSTGVVTLNLLFSGKIDGGIPIGKISQMPAPPSLGKSFVALSLIKNAQKKGMYCIMVDTEKAFDFDWAKDVGIDTSQEKLLVLQNNRIENVQTKLLKIVDAIPKKERKKVFLVIDSFGNLVTNTTVENAQKGKDVRDMTVPQKKNIFARLLLGTDLTIFIANHTYKNTGGYGEDTSIPGGQVLYHNCECIVLASTKAKEKKTNEPDITGQLINCRTFKSRIGKEHSRLKFRIKTNGGLDIFYGLLDDALAHGCVEKSGTRYTRQHIKEDKKHFEKDIYNSDFWLPIFKETDFPQYLEKKYSFEGSELDISNFEISEEL
jgi:recombination protein RecA